MVRPLTQTEITAICNSVVLPHPDGQPWTKCCGDKANNEDGCMCLMRKPKNGRSRYTKGMTELKSPQMAPEIRSGWISLENLRKEGGRFFCVHRTTEDGFHRECAGWAAKFNKKGNCNVAVCETGISVDCAASGQAGHVDRKGKGIGRYFKLFSRRQNP